MNCARHQARRPSAALSLSLCLRSCLGGFTQPLAALWCSLLPQQAARPLSWPRLYLSVSVSLSVSIMACFALDESRDRESVYSGLRGRVDLALAGRHRHEPHTAAPHQPSADYQRGQFVPAAPTAAPPALVAVWATLEPAVGAVDTAGETTGAAGWCLEVAHRREGHRRAC